MFSDHRWLMTQAIGWKARPWVYLEGTTKLWLSVRGCVDAGGLTWSKMSIFWLRLQLGTKKAKMIVWRPQPRGATASNGLNETLNPETPP